MNDKTTDIDNDYPTIHTLLQRAKKVRQRRIRWYNSNDPVQLSYEDGSSPQHKSCYGR